MFPFVRLLFLLTIVLLFCFSCATGDSATAASRNLKGDHRLLLLRLWIVATMDKGPSTSVISALEAEWDEHGQVISGHAPVSTLFRFLTLKKASSKDKDLCKEVSMQLKLDENVTAMLLRLSSFHSNLRFKAALLRYVRQHRVFKFHTFIRSLVPKTRDCLVLDLVSSLASPCLDPETNPWDSTVKKYTAQARESCTLAFLGLVAFCCAVCGWFGAFEEPTVVNVEEVLTFYTSPSWCTVEMHSQDGVNFSRKGMCKGWRIVDEALKMLIPKVGMARTLGSGRSVSDSDVKKCLGVWCKLVLQEVVIFMLLQCDRPAFQTADDASSHLLKGIHSCYAKLCAELNCTASSNIDAQVLARGVLSKASMADICCRPDQGIELVGETLSQSLCEDIRNRMEVKNSEEREAQSEDEDPWRTKRGPITAISARSNAIRERGAKVFGRLIQREGTISRLPYEEGKAAAGVTDVERGEPKRKGIYSALAEVVKMNIEKRDRALRSGVGATHGAAARNATVSEVTNFRASSSDFSFAGAAAKYPTDTLKKPERRAANPSTSRAGSKRKAWEVAFGKREKKEKRSRFQPNAHELQRLYSGNIRNMRNVVLGYPVEADTFLRFAQELPESDAEEIEEYESETEGDDGGRKRNEQKRLRRLHNLADRTLDVDIEVLHASVTFPNIDRRVHQRPEKESSAMLGTDYWLGHVIESNRPSIKGEASDAQTCDEYSDYLKFFLYLELHYTLKSMLENYPLLRDESGIQLWGFSEHLKRREPRMMLFTIRKVQPSTLLINFKCVCTNPSLNKKVIDEVSGMTLCAGFIRRSAPGEPWKRDTDLMLFVCRSLSYVSEDIDRVSMEPRIDMVSGRFCGNRALLDEWSPCRGDTLYFEPLESLVAFYRMFRASHNISRAPRRILDTLYGKLFPQPPGNEPEINGLREAFWSQQEVRSLRLGVDGGCLQYLDGLSEQECNPSQKNSLLMILREMGGLVKGSSSFSLVVGPPGTGKTTTIALLVGALLFHSTSGHDLEGSAQRKETNMLKRRDGRLRCSDNVEGVRILACCSSNQAIDNVARKLKSGIPNGKGGKMFPEIVRVGRQRYDYKDLRDISMFEKSMAFQRDLDDKNNETGCPSSRLPSSKTMQAMAKECIVFLTTLSTAASRVLSDLKPGINVIVMDEGAHATEAECLIPIAAATRTWTSGDRLHIVSSGDHKQLPPVLKSQHAVGAFLSKMWHFPYKFFYKKQIQSLFERMVESKRCPVAWLCRQYRMHPSIGQIQATPVYMTRVAHPESSVGYIAPYNSGDYPSFAPFTFVDTSCCRDRYERVLGPGQYVNYFEAERVDAILHRLESVMTKAQQNRDIPVLTTLRDEVVVTSPYRSQVDALRDTLCYGNGFLADFNRKKRYNVLIESVDALQGLERRVVIVSLTRSNGRNDIGFLNDVRRINVATSRCKNLLILVGDSTTVNKNSRLIRGFWEACLRGKFGSRVEFVKGARGRKEWARVHEVEEMTNILRDKDGYDLRSR